MAVQRIFTSIRWGILLGFALMTLFWGAAVASAADITWDGGGGDNNWSTGANWVGDTAPGSGDVAVFDGTSTKDATIDSGHGGTVSEIDMNSGYTGTITVSRSLTLNSNFDIAAGTFDGSSQTIDIKGNVVISGGSFTSTSGTMTVSGSWTHISGGTFAHNNGKVLYDGNSKTWNFNTDHTGSGEFYDFDISTTSSFALTISTGDSLAVANDFTCVDGKINTGNIDVSGDVDIQSSCNGGTAPLRFVGSGSQSFDLTGAVSVWDSSVSVQGSSTVTLTSDLTMDSTGTLTVSSGTLSVGSNVVTTGSSATTTVSGGTLNFGSGASSLAGALTITGGAVTASSGTMSLAHNFTHTGGGSFAHNNGTIQFITSGSKTWNFNDALTGSGEFYNLTINTSNSNAVTISSGDTAYVANDFTCVDGKFNTGTIDVKGDVDIQAACNGGTSPLQLTGSSAQSLDLTGAESDWNSSITINSSSTVTLTSNLTMDDTGDLTVSGGTFTTGSNVITTGSSADVTVSGGTFTMGSGDHSFVGPFTISGGAVTASSGTMDFAHNFTHTAGGTFAHNNGTVRFVTSGNRTWNFDSGLTGSGDFYNFTLNTTSANPFIIASGDTMVVENAFTCTDGKWNTGTLAVQGDATFGASCSSGTGPLHFSGGNNQALDLTGNTSVVNTGVTVNKSGGALSLASDFVMDAGEDLTITEGIFNANGYNLTVNGGSGAYFTVESGGDFQWNGDETLTLQNTIVLSSGSTVTYNDTSGSRAIQDYAYSNLVINGSGGTFTLGAAESITGSLAVTAGTFDLSDQSMTIDGSTTIDGGTLKTGTGAVTFGDASGDTVTISSGGLEVESDATDTDITINAGTWTNSGGTITYNASGSVNTKLLSGMSPYPNLTINSSSGTYTLDGAIDVNGSLVITAGTLDASTSNYGITVGGNWDNSGTFTSRNGTVTFDDVGQTSTISGSTSFYNFTSTTASKAITFTASTTQTVTGTLTLTGTSGNLITLRSSVTDTAWNLNVSGSSSVSYVDVKDSNASSGSAIDPGSGSTDSGGNTNWVFNTAPTATSLSVTPVTDGTGYVTISIQVDDADDHTLGLLAEYNIGGGWTKATIVTSGATASHSTPTVTNANAYPVANITTLAGASTVSFQWNSKSDEASADLTTAQIRVTPYDGTAAGTAETSSNFTLDNAAPSSLASFSMSAVTSTSVTWGWTAASDTRFDHYEVWYGTNQTDVNNRNGTATEWDGDDDSDLSTATTASTTITGLSENTTYYAKIWAIDTYGNEATLSAASANSNGLPTLSSLSATQSSNGDGLVTISVTVDDANDDMLELAVNYYESTWQKATLTDTISATYGTPGVNNSNARQIGTATTSSGANTITFVWNSNTDLPNANSNDRQISVQAHDGTENGSILYLLNALVDNTDPVGLADLAKSSSTSTSVTLSWTAVTSETSFDHYEIWYGTDSNDVNNRTGSASEWDGDDDSDLNTMATTGTTVTGLTLGQTYYFKIWAVDTLGNESTIDSISTVTNSTPSVTSVTPIVATDGTGSVSIQVVVDDGDDESLELDVDYSIDGGATWASATLDSAVTVASGTAPSVNNSNARQVGTTGSRISTSSGANTVTLTWNSKTDRPSVDVTTAKIRVAAYDGGQTSSFTSSSAFTLDNALPSGLRELDLRLSNGRLKASWLPVLTESRFDHYELWYSTTTVDDVLARNSNATEWDGDNDTAMRTQSTGTTTLTSLQLIPGAAYSVAIWAIDTFGNESLPLSGTLVVPGISTSGGGVVTGSGGGAGGGGGGGSSGGSSSDAGTASDSVEVDSEQADDSAEVETISDSDPEVEVTDEFTEGDATAEADADAADSISETDEESSIEVDEVSQGSSSGASSVTEVGIDDSIETSSAAEELVETISTLDEAVESVDELIPDDVAWAENSLKDFGELDAVKTVHDASDDFQDLIFNFFFEPTRELTRMETLQLALHLFDEVEISDQESEESTATVDDSEPHYIAQGVSHGIIDNVTETAFRGDDSVTRMEALKMVMEAYGRVPVLDIEQGLLSQYSFSENPFADMPLDFWGTPYAFQAYQDGLITGYDDGTFRPHQPLTRAEFSVMVTRLIQN